MKAALLLLLLLALRASCEQQAWVDPFDMTGDSEAPTVPEKRPLQAKPAPTPLDPPASAPMCPAQPEGIDYRTFYRQLVRQLWSKVGGARRRLNADLLRALVRVSPRAEHVLDAFVNDAKESAVPEVNEAFDSIFHAFIAAEGQPASSSWLQPAQLREALTGAILAGILVAVLLPTLLIARSNFSGLVRFFLGVFYLSWVWAWIVLFKKEVASRRAAFATQSGACQPEPWFVEIGHYLASYLVVVPDHCAALHERLEVDPWLEVTPVRALVHMLTQMLLEPSRPLADHLVRFVRTVSAGLPVPHAIAALLVVVFVTVLLLTYVFGYRIRIPFLLAVEPAERRESLLPPEAEARLEALIRSTLERHHSALLERSMLARRPSSRAERILTHRTTKGEAEAPLEEESGSEEEAERVPEVLT